MLFLEVSWIIFCDICHRFSALVGVKGADGKSIFDGKEATGFSNVEEEQAGKVAVSFIASTLHPFIVALNNF